MALLFPKYIDLDDTTAHSVNMCATLDLYQLFQATGSSLPLKGSFDAEFYGVGTFQILFSYERDGNQFQVTPASIGSVSATFSSILNSETLECNVDFKSN